MRTSFFAMRGDWAIPSWVRHRCRTTRRAVPLSDIDSVRTQATDPGKMLIVGTGVAIAVVFAVTSQVGK